MKCSLKNKKFGRLQNKIQRLREKIALRTKELGVEPAHDSTGHWYRFNNNLYPSVTAKLSLLKDPGLANWKMNKALESIAEKWRPNQGYGQELIDAIIVEAKAKPQMEFEGAGDIGTVVHKWREEWFRRWIECDLTDDREFIHSPRDPRPEVIASCKAIENCINKLQAQPLACELFLADEKLKLGGTLDDIWRVGDETWLVDLKTSNQVWSKNSYFFQVVLYWHMFWKLYKIKIDKIYILHTSKKIFGSYELIPLLHPQRYLRMAKNALKLYDDLKELDQIKRLPIVKI